MEQRDYLLREIEKIGMIINAIRQKLFGGHEQLSISLQQKAEDAKGLLLSELGIHLDEFCLLDIEASHQYLKSVKGFNLVNIERLADLLCQIGFGEASEASKRYLEKSLQLYELCNGHSRSYSIEREGSIAKIKDAL